MNKALLYIIIFTVSIFTGCETYKDKPIDLVIDDFEYTLINGYSITDIVPGSASKDIIRIVGKELYTDLNNDNKKDVLFTITLDSGGSGIFYYIVAGIKKKGNYLYSNVEFIADRIIPVKFVVNSDKTLEFIFLDRREDDSMSIEPSLSKRVFLDYNNGYLKVLKNELSIK